MNWDDACTLFESLYVNWDPDMFKHHAHYHGFVRFLYSLSRRNDRLSFLGHGGPQSHLSQIKQLASLVFNHRWLRANPSHSSISSHHLPIFWLFRPIRRFFWSVDSTDETQIRYSPSCRAHFVTGGVWWHTPDHGKICRHPKYYGLLILPHSVPQMTCLALL